MQRALGRETLHERRSRWAHPASRRSPSPPARSVAPPVPRRPRQGRHVTPTRRVKGRLRQWRESWALRYPWAIREDRVQLVVRSGGSLQISNHINAAGCSELDLDVVDLGGADFIQ